MEASRVCFERLDPADLETYLDTGEPMDKAGAYGIQGWGGIFVPRIEGDYFNVMGLPLAALAPALSARRGGRGAWLIPGILETVRWRDGRVRILDQTRLPAEEVYLDLATTAEVIDAIRRLAVRGAPAIGVAGALAVAQAARPRQAGTPLPSGSPVCRSRRSGSPMRARPR